MTLTIMLLLAGLVLLLKGGDWLVTGASGLARRHRISELAIGLTIVAFGTSAPELIVNVLSSAQGHADIALGNVIGSNNFNIFIILGISALMAPIAVKASIVWKEIPISLVAVVMLLILTNDGIWGDYPSILSRFDGILLLLLFALFMYYVYRNMKAEPDTSFVESAEIKTRKAIFLITAGLAGLIVGGKLVVDSAVDIARAINISEKVIGLTIVAAGTSLPELVTSVMAVRRKNNDIAVGNVIGSNIFNIFFVLGISSVINPMTYNPVFNIDTTILIIGTMALFLAMFTGGRKKLDRWEAAIFVIFYIGYLVWLISL